MPSVLYDSPRVLVTWCPLRAWHPLAGRWFGAEVSSTSRARFARVLGLEVVVFRTPRR